MDPKTLQEYKDHFMANIESPMELDMILEIIEALEKLQREDETLTMFDLNITKIKQLLEAGIPVDDYARAADAVQDFEEFVETGDPVKDFKEMILLLNENEALHPELSAYCDRYQVQYKEMDPFMIQLPDEFDF